MVIGTKSTKGTEPDQGCVMKKLTVGSIALTALIAGPAMAADMPPMNKAPPPVAVFTWTGCYIGGHVGGGSATKAFNGGPFVGAFPTALFSVATTALSDNSIDIDSNAFLGGGQVGCNYQIAPNWVLGVEGDASWSNLRGNKQQTTSTTLFEGIFPTSVNSTGILSWKADSIATLTGRLGYTSDRTVIYAKGGAAWARDKYSFNGQLSSTPCIFLIAGACIAPFPTVTTAFNFTGSETRPGWTVGGGLEWAIWNNWSVKVEYDHLDLGRRTVTFTDPVQGRVNVDVTQRINEVTFGVNYRFGYSPVVANY